MDATMRNYQDQEDYWRIREFLRQIFLLNNRQELSWQVARLDYWRWHGIENCQACRPVEEVTFLWQTSDGQIAAVLNPESKKEAFLQVHPAWRTPELEEEMIAVAEDELAFTAPDGRHKLYVWAHAHDTLRQEILERRGYTRGQSTEYQRYRALDQPLPRPQPAPNYSVRPLGDSSEIPARSWASWRAFHPDEPDDQYEGWEWYHNIQRMPLYRRDLDIVAEAPDGTLAAFCTLWYDDVTRCGYFEPVGTVPEHQQRGLGRAVMLEAMHRLKRMGAVVVTVAGFTTAANALYSSVVSPEYIRCEPWLKEW